jgi:NAD-dependent DNA ligase
MTQTEAVQRIATLRAELSRADELYYRQARPELTDLDYDRRKRELADLEAAWPLAALEVGAESPTRRIGDDRAEGFVRVKHRAAISMRASPNSSAAKISPTPSSPRSMEPPSRSPMSVASSCAP